LRKPGPLQAMLDAVDLASMLGCTPTVYGWRPGRAVLDAA
jgi:predicted deacetylase